MFVFHPPFGFLVKIIWHVQAYSGGVPFRAELMKGHNEMELGLEDPIDARLNEDENLACHEFSLEATKVTFPERCPDFVRALPVLNLRRARLEIKQADQAAIKLVDGLRAMPGSERWLLAAAHDVVAVPIEKRHMERVADFMETSNTNVNWRFLTVARQKNQNHKEILIQEWEGAYAFDPEIHEDRIALFCEAAGCTYEPECAVSEEVTYVPEAHWRLLTPDDWRAFIRALPELFGEGGHVELHPALNWPQSVREFLTGHYSTWFKNHPDTLRSFLADESSKFPLRRDVCGQVAERLGDEDLSQTWGILAVVSPALSMFTLAASDRYLDLHGDISESDLAPWCEKLGIRYRRYEPQSFFKTILLALRGKTLD